MGVEIFNNEERSMPLVIENNFNRVSLAGLVKLRERGYSVIKTPHVGNQHPSNLVCAALGIPLEMVSFTQGLRDKNFHPHLRIARGVATELYNPATWTPFARLASGQLATERHQSSVQAVFPQTDIYTDIEKMREHPALTAVVLHASNEALPGQWYRQVSTEGHVYKRPVSRIAEVDLDTNVFGFSNQSSGWIVPNRVGLVFDCVWQALSSGRSTAYHLSGPQMVTYVEREAEALSKMYDGVRRYIPELPFTMILRVVPVAAARFVTRRDNATDMKAVCETIQSLGQHMINDAWYSDIFKSLPELVEPIESGTFLSHYDLSSADDLYLDPWMIETPLREVSSVYGKLLSAARRLAAA